MIQRLFIIIFSLLLSACGFHLRGSYQMPPELQAVYVSYSHPFDPFVTKLQETLRRSGVSISTDAGAANYILQIDSISKTPILQSSSTTGQINTYALQYNVRFQLLNKSGAVLLPSQEAQSTETYTLSSTQLLTNFSSSSLTASDAQENNAINQILFRLSGHNTQKALQADAFSHETHP